LPSAPKLGFRARYWYHDGWCCADIAIDFKVIADPIAL